MMDQTDDFLTIYAYSLLQYLRTSTILGRRKQITNFLAELQSKVVGPDRVPYGRNVLIYLSNTDSNNKQNMSFIAKLWGLRSYQERQYMQKLYCGTSLSNLTTCPFVAIIYVQWVCTGKFNKQVI